MVSSTPRRSLLTRLGTYWALGPANVVRVGLYRLGLKTGLHPVLRLKPNLVQGPFFRPSIAPAPEGAIARQDWADHARIFGQDGAALDGPPDWFANALDPAARATADRPWHRIADFDAAVGDIKTVWETSRFDWAIAMAQRAVLGVQDDLARLEAWLTDWVGRNPAYQGANWKCGQEASIRVMHVALTARILGQDKDPAPGLQALVRQHLARIAPTMGYAIGQANNHGTSEAAALFIGGTWLGGAEGKAWAHTGRQRLAERAQTLIAPDGTFSQYSVTYHRVMLDTYALAEAWRRRRDLPRFDDTLYTRLGAAADWLAGLTDPETGDAPNLGAHDGARLIALSATDDRDYRPSVQLAQVLFRGRAAYGQDGPWDQPLIWLGVPKPDLTSPAPISQSHDHGGLHVLYAPAAAGSPRGAAYLRYPRFRFRPSQADALHLDLWVHGQPLLRDGGTYSYNAPGDWGGYFSGTVAHNTIEMDGRDQMPRLGRFLFARWLTAQNVLEAQPAADGGIEAAAGYRDHQGAWHHRHVRLTPGRLVCTDRIGGFQTQAMLRWRLAPGTWHLTDDKVQGQTHGHRIQIHLKTDIPHQSSLQEGWESRHYLDKTPLPVWEIALNAPGTVVTEIWY